jgi:membrane-bound lytic murein transglycosylase D
LAPELKKRDIGRAYEEVVRYTQKAGAIPQEELSAYVSSQVRALMRTFRMDPESIPEMFMSRVHDQVENFLHRERGFFSRSLSRAGQHLPMIVRIFDEMYLPEELAYVALVESGFNAKAKSPAGAVGLWQFMPKTARDYGLDVSPERGTDERDDPVRSTKAAATYFKNLFMDFGAGSPMLVMAAYNAGEGRVRGALRKGRNPLQERTFWSLLEKQDLTEETNQYVPRILAAIIIAKEPARFGFSETEQEPEGLDEVVVKGGTSLEFVARICRMTCPRLLALNPDLAPETTVIPNSSIQYGLRVPKGFGDLIKAELKRMEGTGSSATRGDGS